MTDGKRQASPERGIPRQWCEKCYWADASGACGMVPSIFETDLPGLPDTMCKVCLNWLDRRSSPSFETRIFVCCSHNTLRFNKLDIQDGTDDDDFARLSI